MKELALIGLVQSLFFSLIVFLKKNKQLKDYFLMSFFICIGAEFLYRYLLYSNSIFLNSKVVLFDIIYWALFGPLLLFYIKSVIEKNLKFRIFYLLHLFPLIISILTISSYLLNKSSYNSFVEFFNVSTGIIKVGLLIWEFSSPAYLLYVIITLFRHKKQIKNYFSNIEKKELNWLLLLTLGFAIYCYLYYINIILKALVQISINFSFNGVHVTILTVYVFVLGIFGYRQEGIFMEKELLISENKNLKLVAKKYQKTGLSSEERELLNQRLVSIMQFKKPYLESEITINDLALQLGTTVHKLSQIINEEYNRNFFDFINNYRINDVKQLLSNSELVDSKIESIAYDCGFNSKSSFYAIFKKHTSLTPTKYRENIKQVSYQ